MTAPHAPVAHADVCNALAAIAEAAEAQAEENLQEISAIQPALSDAPADVTHGALDDIDLVLPDVSLLPDTSPAKEVLADKNEVAPEAAPEEAPEEAPEAGLPAPACTPCDGVMVAPDPEEVQRALDLCVPVPLAPCATPCEGETAAPAPELLQQALDGLEDDASDEESWPASRRFSAVSSATAVSPEPTRMLSFTSTKPEVLPSRSPNAAFPLGTARTDRTQDRTLLDLDPGSSPEAAVWPDCVLARSAAPSRSSGTTLQSHERPAVQAAAAAALERRVSPKEDALAAENADLRARVLELERLMEVHTGNYRKLERQQNEFFQILVTLTDEMAKQREDDTSAPDYRRRTML